MNYADSAWLIDACIAGNEVAIEALVRKYEMGVFRLALSVVGDPVDAIEITQETFIAALRSLPAYQEQHSFKAWLYKIALNLSRSYLRKRKLREKLKNAAAALFRLETHERTLPEETLMETEQEATVWQELNRLDERHRIVVIMRYFQGLSVPEIADLLEINEGTIHSRLHTARERLRIALIHLHGE